MGNRDISTEMAAVSPAKNEGEIGDVYFVACNNEYVKIGFAADVEFRLLKLQTGCPYELKLLARLRDVPAVMERYFHAVLRGQRARGEWFRLTDRVRLLIHKINEGAFPTSAVEVSRLYRVNRPEVAAFRSQFAPASTRDV